jgi:hypothetical protein
MGTTMHKHIMFIIYDGIGNSVFTSQALTPLLNLINEHENIDVTLVSFEKTRPTNEKIISLIPAHDKLHFIMCRRLIFFGKLSLKLATYQLIKLLKLTTVHKIITRGPLAGYIAIHALNKLAKKQPELLRLESTEKLPELIIQARGLCAEEYRYDKKFTRTNIIKKFIQKYIYSSLKDIEFKVYRNKRKTDYPSNITIESVSPALKEYLINNFRADGSKIIIATKDIPKAPDKQQITNWRHEIRTKLNIPQNFTVYCYSGSFKSWQCAKQTIKYFSQKYTLNNKSILVIYTQDKEIFLQELKTLNIPETNYRVLSIKHSELLRYLSVADYGLLFREPDIINWVSRPTKMLEYQAVGLKIIHNDTIAWLTTKN